MSIDKHLLHRYHCRKEKNTSTMAVEMYVVYCSLLKPSWEVVTMYGNIDYNGDERMTVVDTKSFTSQEEANGHFMASVNVSVVK